MVKQKMKKGSLLGIAACTLGIFGLAATAGTSVATTTEKQEFTATVEMQEDRLKPRYAKTNEEIAEMEDKESTASPYSVEDIIIDEEQEKAWNNGEIQIPDDAASVAW